MKCLHVRWHLKRKIPFWYFWKMFNIRKISQILSKGGRCRLSLGRGWQKSNEGRNGKDGRTHKSFWDQPTILTLAATKNYHLRARWEKINLTLCFFFLFLFMSIFLSFSKFTSLMNLCLSFFLIPSISNSYLCFKSSFFSFSDTFVFLSFHSFVSLSICFSSSPLFNK